MLLHVLHKDRFSKYLKINTTTSSKKTTCICHYGPNHRSEVLINFMYPILLLTAHIFTIVFFPVLSHSIYFYPPATKQTSKCTLYIFSQQSMLFHVHWECHKDISKQNYMYTKHYILKEIMSVFC
jgi:hypothetical protein